MRAAGKILVFLLLILAGNWNLFAVQEKHEIEVLGKKIPLNFDTKRGVLVIEGEALRRLPAGGLTELLQLAANMNFMSRGEFQADAQIMGANQEQIGLLLNGAPVNNAQTGHHNFLLPVEVDQIERIEILRGGYSSFAGPSGTGGLINIITSGRSNISLRHSSFATTRASLNLSGKGFYLSSGLLETDGHLEGIDGRKFYLQSGLKLSGERHFVDAWIGWVDSRFGAANFYAPYPSFEKVGRILGAANWLMELSPALALTARFSTQDTRDEFSLFRARPEVYLNRHHTRQYNLDLGVKKTGKKDSLYLGVNAYLDSINSRGIRAGSEGNALGGHQRTLLQANAEYSWDQGKVFFNSGLRAAFGAYRDVSGQALLGYRLSSSSRISLSAFRNLRLPTYTELYYEDAAHRSNPGLTVETNWGTSLSFDFTPGKWGGGAKIYLNHSNNLIDWKWSVENGLWVSANVKSAGFYGLDAHWSYMGAKTTCRLLYTFQETRIPDAAAQTQFKYRFYIPRHSLGLTWIRDFDVLFISAALKLEAEKNTNRTYIHLNLRAQKRIGKIDFFAEAFNIFDQRLEKIPGLPDPPRRYGIGMKFDF